MWGVYDRDQITINLKYGYTVQAESPSDFLIVLFQLEREGGEGGRVRKGRSEGGRARGQRGKRGGRGRGRQKERRRWPCMKQITMQVKLCSWNVKLLHVCNVHQTCQELFPMSNTIASLTTVPNEDSICKHQGESFHSVYCNILHFSTWQVPTCKTVSRYSPDCRPLVTRQSPVSRLIVAR